MKIAIFDTHAFEKDFLSSANQEQHQLNFLSVRLNQTTATLAAGHEAVVIFVHDRVDQQTAQILFQGGTRFLLLRSAGYNHIDLPACKAAGLKVARVPEYSPYAVAEHAIALILSLNRKIHRAYNRVRDGNFSLDGLVGFDLHGKTAGIIGIGRIGRQTAKILHAFGCRVLACDPAPDTDFIKSGIVTLADQAALFSQADIISLHAPLLPTTRHMINASTLAQMKPGVMIINTSRGGLINTRDVITALKSRHIGSLGLDVYEEEDALFFEDHSADIIQDDLIARLLTFPNVIITSHQAFLTQNALEKIASTTFANLHCLTNNLSCENIL